MDKTRSHLIQADNTSSPSIFSVMEMGSMLQMSATTGLNLLRKFMNAKGCHIYICCTKKITTVTMVWVCVPNYHKILPTLALNFSKNY